MTTITLNQAQTTANISNLEQFFQEVLSNSVLQNQLKAATDLESLTQLVVALGEEYGYSFTIQEVQAASAVEAAIGSLWSAEDELSEVDLLAVSGATPNFGKKTETWCDDCWW